MFQQPGVAGPSPSFTWDADGSVASRAEMTISTLLLKIIGINQLPVIAHARALSAQSVVSDKAVVNFKAVFVNGWYAKDVYAFVRDSSGKIVSQVLVLTHDYDDSTKTHTVVPSISEVTSDFTLSGGETFGVMMRVWPAYPAVGSSRNTVTPIDYYSDDPNPRIRKSGNCHTGENHNWEDAPNNFDPTRDDHSDFIYTMTCKEMINDVMITREVQLKE